MSDVKIFGHPDVNSERYSGIVHVLDMNII